MSQPDKRNIVLEIASEGFFMLRPYRELDKSDILPHVQTSLTKTAKPFLSTGAVAVLSNHSIRKIFNRTCSESEIKKYAQKILKFNNEEVEIASCFCHTDDGLVWERTSRMVKTTVLDAVESIARLRVKKEKKDIMTPEGFNHAVSKLKKDALISRGKVDSNQLNKIMAEIGKVNDFSDPNQNKRMYKAIKKAFAPDYIVNGMLPKYTDTFESHGSVTFGNTKKAVKIQHNLNFDTDLNAPDMLAVSQMSQQQGLYVRDSDKNICGVMSNKAQAIVGQGLEDGLSQFEISQELERQIPNSYKKHQSNYMEVVASSFLARTRSYSLASSYTDAGIESFRVVAMLDEATSDICRAMDGMIISVSKSKQLMDEANNLNKPEDIVNHMPWMKTKLDENGGINLIVPKDGKERIVGTNDGTGWNMKKGFSKDPKAVGVGFPPYHALCRTTTIPEDDI